MKDIEKIKSEDLAAQVQDANPANFAIEQEVAQLVGATVPQPTEPSADDARELGAQLLVFLRRALTPIQTALRTALAAIYDHLDSRCTDYTPAGYDPFRLPAGPYDPMRPFVPRTLPNLLQAITAFAPRKISNGSATADGIPDGTSLARLLGAGYSAVTKLYDDTRGWTLAKQFPVSIFPNLEKLHLGCSQVNHINAVNGGSMSEIKFCDDCFINAGTSTHYVSLISGNQSEELTLRFKKAIWYCGDECGFIYHQNSNLKKLTIEDCEYLDIERLFYSPTPQITHLRIPSLKYWYNTRNRLWYAMDDLTDLIDVEVGNMQTSFNLSKWTATNVLADADKTATFLQNFKEHIALRLTANGSGKTLTLSQAVFSAVIEGSSPICDDIKGIIEDKGWKVQDTNNNIFPTT